MASKVNTIHTSRTLMYSELSGLMANAATDLDFQAALQANAIGKTTKTNTTKTAMLLRKLYLLDPLRSEFRAFLYFWGLVQPTERPLLALVFALGNDTLLAESSEVVLSASLGHRVEVDKFEMQVERFHPNRFSPITVHSVGKNLASSWKQGGFLSGKYRNLRIEVRPTYLVVTFAMHLAYLHGDRGEYILASKWVRVLDLSPERLRELAHEAAKRELMVFQSSGSVTAITFPMLSKQLDLHENENR